MVINVYYFYNKLSIALFHLLFYSQPQECQFTKKVYKQKHLIATSDLLKTFTPHTTLVNLLQRNKDMMLYSL